MFKKEKNQQITQIHTLIFSFLSLTITAPAAGAAEKPAEKPKEEEVDALDGGMDMFGGGGGGGGGDY